MIMKECPLCGFKVTYVVSDSLTAIQNEQIASGEWADHVIKQHPEKIDYSKLI